MIGNNGILDEIKSVRDTDNCRERPVRSANPLPFSLQRFCDLLPVPPSCGNVR
jgi:hypothetical protein